jgi:hypothetical protein
MNKLSGTLAVLALMAWAAPALAASPSQEECEASDGIFTKEQGTVKCVHEETVGNAPETSNAQRVKSTDQEQGNLTPKDQEPLVCEGPKGQQPEGC